MAKKFNNDSESQESYHGLDETDSGPTRLLVALKRRILEEPMFFVSLSTEELHDIADLEPEALQRELDSSTQRAQLILDSCQQELSRRTEIKETHELLRICEKAFKNVNRKGDDSYQESKKLKTSDIS